MTCCWSRNVSWCTSDNDALGTAGTTLRPTTTGNRVCDSLRERQDLVAIRGDQDGMLELGSAASILGDHCPIIWPSFALWRPGTQDWLDGESLPGHHLVQYIIGLVYYARMSVEDLADPVPAEILDDSEIGLSNILLTSSANLVDGHAGRTHCDALMQALLRGFYQVPALLVHLANAEHAGGVSVVPIKIHGDINVYDVTIL
mmetsp:Transcript_7284/g.21460  ORF Transcript_7284/g.21460 Transcript_7284/m.21460 type:complete len:202 (-) Transcript_7284:766-1371(-)